MGPFGPDLEDEDDWDDDIAEDIGEEVELPYVLLWGLLSCAGFYLAWQVAKWLWGFLRYVVPH